MGKTATEWTTQVSLLLRDSTNLDVSPGDVTSIGVLPALAQYSIDRPRSVAVDLTPSTYYLPLPAALDGWVSGWSRIESIEAPSGQTPSVRLANGSWVLTRDAVTPATQVVLMPFTLTAGQKARVFFTATWPTPTTVAADDLVPSVAFLPICSLAAAMCCWSLATEAARSRQGAMPTDFVDGSDRARNLLDVAAGMRVIYNTFIGLGVADGESSQSKGLRSIRMVTT